MNETVERIVRANPVPGATLASDGFVDSAAIFSSIVSRRDGMADTRIDKDKLGSAVAVQTAWYRHPAVVAVSAAVAVIIVIGAAALLFGGADGPTADTPPTIAPTPVTEAAEPTTPEAAEPTTSTTVPETTTTAMIVSEAFGTPPHWSVVTDPGAFGGEEGQAILAITRGDDRFVAVGVEGADPMSADALRHPVEEWDQNAAFWTSVDGADWMRVPHDESIFGGDGGWVAEDVVAGGAGYVAVGWGGPRENIDAAVWTSTNGEQWQRITDGDLTDTASAAAMYSIANTGNGLVAVGTAWEGDSDTGRDEPAVWTSADGLEWERIPHGDWALGGRMYGVASSEYGVIAVGVVDEENGSAGAVWTSPDGITWSQHDGDPAVFRALTDGSPEPDWIYYTELSAITATDDAWVAAGHDFAFNPTGEWDEEAMSPRAVVLTSPDGLIWERVDLERPTVSAIWSTVESDERIIALGGPTIWVSADGGRTWDMEQRTDGEWLDAAPGNVGPVAVGRIGGDGAVWIGTWNEEDG